MQALFLTAPQPRSEHRSIPTDVLAHHLSGSGLLGSAKPESETTGHCEQRSRESAVRDSLRNYSRTGDQASAVRPRHTPDPRPTDTPDNRPLFRGAP